MRAIVTHHCSVCHTDVIEGAHHSCGGTPTPCVPACYAGSVRLSKTLIDHARHVQARLTVAERERDEALDALRPFAEAHQRAVDFDLLSINAATPMWAEQRHFARAAEVIKRSSPQPAHTYRKEESDAN